MANNLRMVSGLKTPFFKTSISILITLGFGKINEKNKKYI
jgi:hypothetical protein